MCEAEAEAVMQVFVDYQMGLDEEQEKRESIRQCVRELESTARMTLTTAQAVHQPTGLSNVEKICADMERHLATAAEQLQELAALIPQHEYYRYHDHWRFVVQRLCFLCALLFYLKEDQLLDLKGAAGMLHVKTEQSEGLHLDLDDFLIGLLQLATELSRLSVNAVTAGDYARPLNISRFVSRLSSGFRLLNLKNDSLRKRFDALKYDVKKIEEVVYDVTIRGLTSASST